MPVFDLKLVLPDMSMVVRSAASTAHLNNVSKAGLICMAWNDVSHGCFSSLRLGLGVVPGGRQGRELQALHSSRTSLGPVGVRRLPRCCPHMPSMAVAPRLSLQLGRPFFSCHLGSQLGPFWVLLGYLGSSWGRGDGEDGLAQHCNSWLFFDFQALKPTETERLCARAGCAH